VLLFFFFIRTRNRQSRQTNKCKFKCNFCHDTYTSVCHGNGYENVYIQYLVLVEYFYCCCCCCRLLPLLFVVAATAEEQVRHAAAVQYSEHELPILDTGGGAGEGGEFLEDETMSSELIGY